MERLSLFLTKTLPGIRKVILGEEYIILEVFNESLLSVCKILKYNEGLRFRSLLDIWGVDYPGQKERFEVNYLFLSVKYNLRVIVRVSILELEGVNSLTALFSSSGWLEREVWDMYGVIFFGNNDLRRILTDYGFKGHPLRKDFPLTGFTEVRYDDSEKRVVYEPVEVAQEFRLFDFKSPWDK